MGESNPNEILKMVAGIVITILVITIGFTVYNAGSKGVQSGLSEIDNMNTTITESRYTSYEGQTVTGSQVQSLLSTWASDTIAIGVKTKTTTTVYQFNYTSAITTGASANDCNYTLDDSTKITATNSPAYANNSAVCKKSEACYVNPAGQFDVEVCRNANGVIVGVMFTQK